MAILLMERSAGKVLEVRLTGKLTHSGYLDFVPEFERLVKLHGKLSILAEMIDFHGWEAGAVWDDIKLDVKHFSDISRIALVGETKWEKAMSTFCKPFTTAKIRYFDRAALDEARAWVEQGELAAAPR